MTITRRDLLAGSAAITASSFMPRAFAAPLPRDAEVVVIGAGAAGIAAETDVSEFAPAKFGQAVAANHLPEDETKLVEDEA